MVVMQAVSQVAVGPRLLDFGKVSAASRNVRYLAVSNPLLQSIHVVLALAHLPELNSTEPVSQVIFLYAPLSQQQEPLYALPAGGVFQCSNRFALLAGVVSVLHKSLCASLAGVVLSCSHCCLALLTGAVTVAEF